MRQEMIFNVGQNNYVVGKHYFQKKQKRKPKKKKKTVNINKIDIKKIVLSNKASYGKKSATKYYIGDLSDDFRPLCIIIKEIKLYTDRVNILADNK